MTRVTLQEDFRIMGSGTELPIHPHSTMCPAGMDLIVPTIQIIVHAFIPLSTPEAIFIPVMVQPLYIHLIY